MSVEPHPEVSRPAPGSAPKAPGPRRPGGSGGSSPDAGGSGSGGGGSGPGGLDPDEPAPGEEPLADRDPDIVAAAEAEAEELRADTPVLGTPGPPVNRRSPFMVGLLGAAGVAVTYGLVQLAVVAGSILALIGLSLFLAVGLEPAVAWLTRRRLPRGLAVAVVSLAIVGVVVTVFATAIPLLAAQVEAFLTNLPTYVGQMIEHSATLRRLDGRFGLREAVAQIGQPAGAATTAGLLSAGEAVLSATVSTVIVLVLTVYLLIDLPRIRRLIYRLTPASRRPRIILIGDEVSTKVGRYVLGNLLTSLIAGVAALVWLLAWHVPYPVVLALMVAVLDLVPIVGSSVAGLGTALVALTVSFPVALATIGFFVAYRFIEDYLIVPRVIGRAVEVPATATIVAVLVGGTALGVIGALVAIPAAAAIEILLRETVYPRLDRT